MRQRGGNVPQSVVISIAESRNQMLAQDSSRAVARFADYEVDFRAGELYKAGRKIRLQVQPFHILAMLLEHPGEVVTRTELQKHLWPEDTFVDFDHSLNTAIKKLRQALCDDKKKPRFVETLPKRGYRFIGAVEHAAKPASRPKTASASALMGQIGKISADGEADFILLSVDRETASEREKLDAVNDDVGLSVLIASQKLLIVPDGTPVRIIEVDEHVLRCQVRILEGEHYGKTALAPLKSLTGLAHPHSRATAKHSK
jgi:DNA-binding winged helix-turn-helix (wHTH) protein